MKSIINLKKIAFALLVATALTASVVSCNSSAEYYYTLPSSATVRSFSLAENDKILPNLDSVFFSIDLVNCEIYNADSLPFGTKVTGLQPVITTESASVVELTVTDKNGEAKTINYLENTTDTIDFTNPVAMRVVSFDGAVERNYTIRVNVHTIPVDTLVWTRIESGNLPTVFNAVNKQHTSMSPDGTYYCLTMYQNQYALAYTDNPGEAWNVSRINPGFEVDVNSLTATTDALYLLDNSGKLYKSEDLGQSWSDTGTTASFLIGAYGNRLLATLQTAGSWSIVEYPAGKTWNAPTAFPVLNTSNSTSVTFEMSTAPQMFVTGGRKADGTLSADTWGFDGSQWVNVTRRSLPVKLENLALVPYFNLQADTTSWRVSVPQSVLLAIGGNRADGTLNDSVYMSADFGMNWYTAPSHLQIPTSVIPLRTRAQAYPFVAKAYASPKTKRMATQNAEHSVFTMRWNETGFNLPYETAPHKASRATAPITEWDVPYIYLFGGENQQGVTYNTIYRGVITAFTQLPLQ